MLRKPIVKTLAYAVVLPLIGLVVGVPVLYAAGARINASNSLPMGLYWVVSEKPEKGAYIAFCPPSTPVFDMALERHYITGGFCEGGYGYLMKKILAAKNDHLQISAEGVWVNGSLLPHSKPKTQDGKGRALPLLIVDQIIPEGYILPMTESNDKSFDGRYFGLVPAAKINDVIRPVFTW